MDIIKRHLIYALIFGLFFIIIMEFHFYSIGSSLAELGRVTPPEFGEAIMNKIDLMVVMVFMGMIFYYSQLFMVLFLVSFPIIAFLFFFGFAPVAIAHMLLPVGYSFSP